MKTMGETIRERRGARIFTRRRQLGLSQETVGAEIGMSAAGYGMKERGINGIDIDEIPAIARHLQVPIRWFFEEHGAWRDDEAPAIARIAEELPSPHDRDWLADLASRLAALPPAERRAAEERLTIYLRGLTDARDHP